MLEKLRYQIYDCSRCGFCRVWGWEGVENVCPTYPYTPGWETQYARGRVRLARATLENEIEITDALLEHAFQCTLCASCQSHCPVGVPLADIFHAWRVDLATAGHSLLIHRRIAENVVTHHNLYGPRGGRWGGEASPARKKASILYFPGCTTIRKARKVVQATGELLGKLGLDFAVLEDDACCGYPLYETGQVETAREAATWAMGHIKEHDPDILLTTCPSCYRVFKMIYPREMGVEHSLEVVHISQFLPPLVAGKMTDLEARVTWHDPCVLGRHLKMYDPPRDLLRAVPGLELVEMYSSRENALCCGAGGGVFSAFDEIAARVAAQRLRQVTECGAELLATSCPACYVNFQRMIGRDKLNVQVKDLVEIINEALP
ncbi:MAG: (Fe-S)-binding protein [Chloroflexi bacterium]|nr:(Fe-S)-binding protein [Chloroflexota bacterium]MCL5075929.1 (Fe-S)-binding protein [Chloroflexota bacterium]